MESFILLRKEFIECLQTLAGDDVKVYLALVDRGLAQKKLRVGLSLPELARRANVGTGAAKQALENLKAHKLIVMTEKGKNWIIDISPYYTDDETIPIPFTFQNTDENKIRTVENELSRLQLAQERGIMKRESGIAAKLSDDKRDVVATIERDLGRALELEEAFLVGQLLGGFDPARVKLTWQRKAATAKNPVRALHAIMWNLAVGKPMQKKELMQAPNVRDL